MKKIRFDFDPFFEKIEQLLDFRFPKTIRKP
jgi:hypothetical protein